MIFKDGSIFNCIWINDKREGVGLMTWPNGTCFYGQMENDNINQGLTMTSDLIFIFSPRKNSSYNQKGFRVANFTEGVIDCFQDEESLSCYNQPEDIKTIYLGGFGHYYEGEIITVRRIKVRNGFGEYVVNGSYYIGEWKQGYQSGFGLLSQPYGPTLVGTFQDGNLEKIGAIISYSANHRTVYLGGFWKGKKDGPGLFIYPTGEKVLGYFYAGKLVQSMKPIYLYPNGTKANLVSNRG